MILVIILRVLAIEKVYTLALSLMFYKFAKETFR